MSRPQLYDDENSLVKLLAPPSLLLTPVSGECKVSELPGRDLLQPVCHLATPSTDSTRRDLCVADVQLLVDCV
eukprot:761792-Hanusia_phi.AAC.2